MELFHRLQLGPSINDVTSLFQIFHPPSLELFFQLKETLPGHSGLKLEGVINSHILYFSGNATKSTKIFKPCDFTLRTILKSLGLYQKPDLTFVQSATMKPIPICLYLNMWV